MKYAIINVLILKELRENEKISSTEKLNNPWQRLLNLKSQYKWSAKTDPFSLKHDELYIILICYTRMHLYRFQNRVVLNQWSTRSSTDHKGDCINIKERLFCFSKKYKLKFDLINPWYGFWHCLYFLDCCMQDL